MTKGIARFMKIMEDSKPWCNTRWVTEEDKEMLEPLSPTEDYGDGLVGQETER